MDEVFGTEELLRSDHYFRENRGRNVANSCAEYLLTTLFGIAKT